MANAENAPGFLPAQNHEELYGPEMIRIASDVLWRVMYEHPDPTEKVYKPTTHRMDPEVYRKLLAGGKYTEERIEKVKKEQRGSDGPVLRIKGKMHAACESDDPRDTDVHVEPIVSIEIWDYHLPREARFQWPIKKLTEKADLREHKKLIREYKEEREAAELEYALVDDEVCKERRKVSEKEEKLRKELDDEKDEREQDKVKMDEMEKKIQELQEKLEVSEGLRKELDRKIEKLEAIPALDVEMADVQERQELQMEVSEGLRADLEEDNIKKDKKIQEFEAEIAAEKLVEMEDDQESPEEMEEEKEAQWKQEKAQLNEELQHTKKVLQAQVKALALQKIYAADREHLLKYLVEHLKKRGGLTAAMKKAASVRDIKSKELHSQAMALLIPKPHQAQAEVPLSPLRTQVHVPLNVEVKEEKMEEEKPDLLTPNDDSMET